MSSIFPVLPLAGTISGEGNLTGTISIDSGSLSGSLSSDIISHNKYSGPYVVTPRKVEQFLDTANKLMIRDVEVEAIRYSEVSNPEGGLTVNIGYE